MSVVDSSARVLIRADGSMLFDQIAVKAFRLRDVEYMLVLYSIPAAIFVLRPLPKGADYGVPLKRIPDGGRVAEQAADFVQSGGMLSAKNRKYDGQFYAGENKIVIRNVGLRKGSAK